MVVMIFHGLVSKTANRDEGLFACSRSPKPADTVYTTTVADAGQEVSLYHTDYHKVPDFGRFIAQSAMQLPHGPSSKARTVDRQRWVKPRRIGYTSKLTSGSLPPVRSTRASQSVGRGRSMLLSLVLEPGSKHFGRRRSYKRYENGNLL